MQLQISLDKLPIKRLDSIEENGVERFPPDLDYDAKRLSLIRQIDFAWAVEKDEEKKKQKSSRETSTTWQWQDLVENLQLAHQELSVIIDLINIVEANDAVTVASMTRPKLLPNEALSDRAVSAAIKLQCYRHVGKYFKQSAKAFEQQVAREARFYGALISKIGRLNGNVRQLLFQGMKASPLISLITHTTKQLLFAHCLCPLFESITMQLECWQ
ncbi:hypothetical protein GLYMA_14G007400v4 [Glycine max]|nr:hypothetical protein GLYMA_14G007400v4 [Glycine max]KAH1092535.1 hypothetical protein GYH30_038646 [Glycine max]